MRILFAGKQHFETGGIESSTDQLARRLLARGHHVGVLAAPGGGTERSGGRHAPAVEEVGGFAYEAFAARGSAGDALSIVRSRFRPDVVVVNAGGRWWHDWTRPLIRAAGPVACVLYVNDREALELLAEPGLRPDMIWSCAESHAAVARADGFDVLTIPSLVEPDLYRTTTTGEAVLYVNPVKSKGVRTALTLAASRRDVPFIFLRSWRQSDAKFAELHRMATVLGNIEMAKSTPDPRAYYARARLLLAPYDDFGRPRVVAEAQLSAIPVLALDEAGNREAVGPGGLLVARDAPNLEWVAALGRLWDDPAEHGRLAEAALAHSRRADMDPEVIVEAVERALGEAVVRARTRRHRAAEPAVSDAPLVSVVLPVRNGAATIDAQLEALSNQTYAGSWELIVSDNGSTDATRGRALSWQGGLPAPVRIVDAAGRRGVARARNVGITAARGELVLICDADDVVDPGWMEHMVDALQDHDIVTGAGELRRLNAPSQYAWTGDADRTDADVAYGFLRHASGGNLGVRREVALRLAGFDETMRRAEDIDWSWRAQYAGADLAFEPGATIHLRMRSDLRSIASSRFRGGLTEPQLYRRHRGRGMRAESWEEVAGMWRWLALNAVPAWRDPTQRQRWTDHAAHRAGRVVGSLRHRTRFL